jgi:hypothetical protein
MNESQLLYSVATGILGILVLLLAWVGNRLHNKLDELTNRLDIKLTQVNSLLTNIDRDLREELKDIELKQKDLEVKLLLFREERLSSCPHTATVERLARKIEG